MQDKLHMFAELVLRINAPQMNVFGQDIPGMIGGAAATQAALTSASDITYDLRLKTAEFMKAQYTHDDVACQQTAKEIEGLLMEEETLSVLGEAQTKRLIDLLHEIMEGQK